MAPFLWDTPFSESHGRRKKYIRPIHSGLGSNRHTGSETRSNLLQHPEIQLCISSLPLFRSFSRIAGLRFNGCTSPWFGASPKSQGRFIQLRNVQNARLARHSENLEKSIRNTNLTVSYLIFKGA
jgi:hypothetical protein